VERTYTCFNIPGGGASAGKKLAKNKSFEISAEPYKPGKRENKRKNGISTKKQTKKSTPHDMPLVLDSTPWSSSVQSMVPLED
jgi:hypothetical protein